MLHLTPIGDASSEFLDAEDIAARLRISKVTVFRWTRAGRLPQPARIDGVVRWRVADFEAWLKMLRPNQDDG